MVPEQAHVASSGEKLPCSTFRRSRLGPCARWSPARAAVSRACASPNLATSRIWNKHLSRCADKDACHFCLMTWEC